MRSILLHPLWPALLPYIRVETYDRDGGHAHPRHRLEVDPLPRALLSVALILEVDCAACRTPIHPVRRRQGRGFQMCLNVSCALRVRYGCARTRAAAREYERIVAAVQGSRAPQQPSFLEGV